MDEQTSGGAVAGETFCFFLVYCVGSLARNIMAACMVCEGSVVIICLAGEFWQKIIIFVAEINNVIIYEYTGTKQECSSLYFHQ